MITNSPTILIKVSIFPVSTRMELEPFAAGFAASFLLTAGSAVAETEAGMPPVVDDATL